MELNKKAKGNLILLLTSAIWGFAFVAQRLGMKYIGPFTFNGVRFALGALSLLPLIYLYRKEDGSKGWKKEFKAGILAGLFLFIAASLQQYGMITTTASNAAFITGMYIVFVPILGIFLKQKVNFLTWIAAVIAIIGLYLLSVKSDINIVFGDYLELMGAIIWAIHILVINHFSKKVNILKLAFFQFISCSILSLIIASTTETISFIGIQNALGAIIYGGICSVGIAYTLQIVGQKNSEPSHAALILSLEAVFGAVGGYIFLKEYMGGREILGCVLMLSGTVLAQLPEFKKEKKI